MRATAAKPAKETEAPFVIHITPGNPPKVHPMTHHMSRKTREEVRWECENDAEFEVRFENSPFTHKTFNKRRKDSGAPIAGGHGEEFKYSVTAGKGTLDPKIIVNP